MGKCKVAFVGLGYRGTIHLKNTMLSERAEIVALCDLDQALLLQSVDLCQENGYVVDFYTDFHKMCEQLAGQMDAVIISASWQQSLKIAKTFIAKQIYVGLEVTVVGSVAECVQMYEFTKQHGDHLFVLENVCYRQDVMAINNMVKAGVFGEIVHAQCGYKHDLRPVLFGSEKLKFGNGATGEAAWRTPYYLDQNADLYPHHGLGPICTMLGIGYQNYFTSITSFATKGIGIATYLKDLGGEHHPYLDLSFSLGDVITSVLQTSNGQTVVVHHDILSPRPYSLGFTLQGNKGIWEEHAQSVICLQEHHQEHRWQEAEQVYEPYIDSLWRVNEEAAKKSARHQMDYIMLIDFLDTVLKKSKPRYGVLDWAIWSMITPLSARSIERGNQKIPFPKIVEYEHRVTAAIF
ncbi:Gfo/Idh/MocA family protein [Persicobacter psychrovividus]|uniref:Alpha-N-acetylgalactosaminidase n=1 Tax=Persicobacter psychrovividus TaxID=387638 RepID=A0ABN6LG80_9BACT|nr:alpha-N-acetylgalactosaminidase [Persicobacter psychrovividus]